MLNTQFWICDQCFSKRCNQNCKCWMEKAKREYSYSNRWLKVFTGEILVGYRFSKIEERIGFMYDITNEHKGEFFRFIGIKIHGAKLITKRIRMRSKSLGLANESTEFNFDIHYVHPNYRGAPAPSYREIAIYGGTPVGMGLPR